MAPPGTGTGFQSFVNKELPPGVAGDFAGANIKSNVVASPFGFAASPAGVTIGVGAWANPNTGIASNYFQPGSFAGFVHREGQALITTFLGIAAASILAGDMVTVMDQGDFWGLFAAGATAGQKVYFDPKTGALTGNTAGNSVSGTMTGSITASVMTISAITGTPLAVGQVVTGTGVVPGTYIASLGTGTGGTGTYNLANVDGTAIANVSSETLGYWGVQETNFFVASPVVADTTFTASLAAPVAPSEFGILTVSAIASGSILPGQYISATGLPGSANIQILQQLTGTTGSTGTYLTNNTGLVIGSTSSFVGTQGKLGKISSWTRPT
jgi:hypothetical protein